MLSDKEIKARFRPRFWAEPDRYYATKFLREEGFVRGKCAVCGRPFWSTQERKICGDPSCGVKFDFIGNSPTKNKLSYIDVWKKFSDLFSKLGYTPIRRYPVVSRWNPTMEYTNASIAAFQPFVISGEVEPPANPLVIPQFCLRFSDIDNVGITGSHHTGFVMIGQHMFVSPDKWDQEKVFRDIYTWLTDGKGLALPKDEIIFHEDAWAGGGDFGCCMEFFSRGCEIGNQVYMLYRQTPTGYKDLPIKVLDMGMGQERCAWFSQGTSTIYDAVFPGVLRKIKNETGIKTDEKISKLISPYRGQLNIDETSDIEGAWKKVASLIGMDVNDLKKEILPSAAIYSIAEHSRSLLVAIADGGLPSNTGGGYNLRVILRRSLNFIDKYGWKLDLGQIVEWHADELREQYPELLESIDEVIKILEVEKRKYESSKQKSKALALKLIEEGASEEKLIHIYDSHGIPPEVIRNDALKVGIDIKIPENFYVKVAKLHENEEKKELEKEEEIDLTGVPETEILYYDDYKRSSFKGRVLKIDDESVVLDQTIFYGKSGGQESDRGTLGGCRVYDVIRQGPYIIHKVEKPNFKIHDIVEGKIDLKRRIQLAQHHTAAHIVNAAARKILGKHVNQAGAYKDVEKGRLDITHYESLTPEEIKLIEEEANKIVKASIPVESKFISRREAEDKYGMRIYQGPAVPGKILRIISIPDVDTEACGGTHVKNTSEVGKIVITKSIKISDSVVRLEFKAGEAAEEELAKEKKLVDDIAAILEVSPERIYKTSEELFEKWKKSEKLIKKLKDPNYLQKIKAGEIKINIEELKLSVPQEKIEEKRIKVKEVEEIGEEIEEIESIERIESGKEKIKEKEEERKEKEEITRIISKTAEFLRTQPIHLPNTLRRFKEQLDKNINIITKMIEE